MFVLVSPGLVPSDDCDVIAPPVDDGCCRPGDEGACGDDEERRRPATGTSKMCRFPLSEVHASMLPKGLKRKEKMVAESVPLRRSAIRAQLLVE